MPEKSHGCCAPSRSDQEASLEQSIRLAEDSSTQNMVKLDASRFLMGSNDTTFPTDGEGPVREVQVNAFYIDKYAVSNADFQVFIEATNYITEAEQFKWSYVFHLFLAEDHPPTQGVASAPWWRQVFGASWRHPEGPSSSIEGRMDHPVTHVSWNDAVAYASWAGKRLPSEAEWEYAARGGLEQAVYPWGDRLSPKGKHRCNIWQGTFPTKNSQKDGYLGTAPVDTFAPNAYGLYNMVGNVWEWCSDWWEAPRLGSSVNPRGPETGTHKVTKGGSYLCHASYCNRYRVAARTQNTADSSTGHMGFRLVKDIP